MTSKVSAKQASAFMAQLLDPLPDAEIADPELDRIERRARIEQWNVAMYEYTAAFHLFEHLKYVRHSHVWSGRMSVREAARAFEAGQREAGLALWKLEERQMLMQAPNTVALKWKRSRLKQKRYQTSEFEAAVASDADRLAAVRQGAVA